MDKYIRDGIALIILFLFSAAVSYIVFVTFFEIADVNNNAVKDPTRPISITTSEADLILVRYHPGTASEEIHEVYVFHTTQDGSKYTCFLTEERVANGVGSGISCTRDIQAVI